MKMRINLSRMLGLAFAVIAMGIAGVSAATRHSPPSHEDKHASPPAHTQTPPAPSARSARTAPAPADIRHGDSAASTKSTTPPITTTLAPPPAKPSSPAPAPTADESLAMLVEGNTRWVTGKCANPNSDISRRAVLAESGQHPSATILTCSDSRLPTERLFDCGVGDIFVVRVAGNVMGSSEAGTIEYGIEHLHTPLLVVMGHTKCGAVSAAATHAHVEGSIATLVKHIDPAVERARRLNPGMQGEQIIPEAIKENVWQSIFDLLKSSEIARNLAREGKIKIVGAVCDISTGKVEWFGEHPWQTEFISAMTMQQATVEGEGSPTQTAGHDSDH